MFRWIFFLKNAMYVLVCHLYFSSFGWAQSSQAASGDKSQGAATNFDIAAGILDFLGKMAWPTIAAVILWKLYPTLQKILESRSFTIKIGGMEISAQQASEQLARQIQELQDKVLMLTGRISARPDLKTIEDSTKNRFIEDFDFCNLEIDCKLTGILPEQIKHKPKHILWVDDRPSNNAFIIDRLRKSGIQVIEALSTNEAVEILHKKSERIEAIISDMDRTEEGKYQPDAGVKLIRLLRESGNNTPIFIFSSVKSAEEIRKIVIEAGGNGMTSSTLDLLEWIDL